MRFDRVRSSLAKTPLLLDAWLRGLPDELAHAHPEGDGTFSAFDVVGHLILGEETDWIPRARTILEHGESAIFEPFDRFAMIERDRGRSLDELLDEFASKRRASLDALDTLGLEPADFARRGRHPAIGIVTLGELLATWVVHDLDHIGQIARVLAKADGLDVGPWRRHLPILG